MKLNILHEDNDILVCVKPYGVPSQSDKTNSEDMVSMLKLRIYERENRSEEPYLAPIHRLDRPVGGIMLFAKTKEAAANLSKQSENGDMVKYYQAILTGELPNDMGTMKDYLLHDPATNVTKIVDKDTPGAKYSELEYEVLDVFDTDNGPLTYVLITLVTGRTHQIRVQTAKRKAGIWGDTKYNPKFQKIKKSYKQIGLHASRLEFNHPVTGEHMVFKNEPEGKAFEVIELDEF
jgi:23S rRNA pseudouridine1911/1915/1917 synthase